MISNVTEIVSGAIDLSRRHDQLLLLLLLTSRSVNWPPTKLVLSPRQCDRQLHQSKVQGSILLNFSLYVNDILSELIVA